MAAAAGGKWADLAPRILSALVLVVIAGLAVWHGSTALAGLASVLTGLMTWELGRMLAPGGGRPLIAIGALAAAIMLLVFFVAMPVSPFIWFLAVPLCLWVSAPEGRLRWVVPAYGFLLQVSVFELVFTRIAGIAPLLWVVLIIIASDVLGYFAGRMIGGPKFWPKVSPKKTWSGTVAGWIGAVIVALGLVIWADFPVFSLALAPLIALAGQMGDIAESALKRRAGVKDSSNLIPGHGGFLDRFDALLGAGVLLAVLAYLGGGF